MKNKNTIKDNVMSLSFHKERDKRVRWSLLLVLFCSLITSHYSLFAQKHEIDSLLTRLKTDKQDTTKANDFRELAWDYRNTGEIKKAMDGTDSAMALEKKLNFKDGLAHTYNIRASIYYTQGDYPNALNYLLKSLEIDEAIKDEARIAENTDDIGLIYKQQGELKKALEYYDKALKADEALNNQGGVCTVMINMGTVYEKLQDTAKAMECFKKARELNKKYGDKEDLAIVLSNIGNVYLDEKDYVKTLQYYREGIKIYEELDDKSGLASDYLDMGLVYLGQKNYKDAETYTLKSLEIAKGFGGLEGIKTANDNLAVIYAATGEWEKALKARKQYSYMKDSIINQAKSKQIGKLEAKAQYDKDLALQTAEEDKKTALAAAESKREKVLILFVAAIALAIAFIAFIIARSLRTARSQKALIEIQTEEVEKQKTVVEEKNQEIMDSINYAKRLQEAILPPLNDIKKFFPESFIIYKPKDIVSGDFYWMGKTLTHSLPRGRDASESSIAPSSVAVATDVPSPLGEGKDEVILIAAADCTGHGVPGALVSVVCSNALNRAVKEFGITEPGKILDKVRELVLETFPQRGPFGEKSIGNVQDGMDISLAALSLLSPKGEGVTGSNMGSSSDKAATDAFLPLGRESERVDQPQTPKGALNEGVRVSWSGANNPLWIVRQGALSGVNKDSREAITMSETPTDTSLPLARDSERAVLELPPDKQPIGRFDRVKPFTTHTVTLQKGDCIYLFTDGYADQFGGPKGKKFKYKQLQEKLLACSSKPMDEQGKILERTFEKWMGFLDQVDDVLLIGIRV